MGGLSMRGRIAMRRVFFLLFVLVLSGCHKQAISQGPHFNLDNPPAKRLEAPVAVTIIDPRPDWERRYFEGDVTLFPLEQMTPPPTERLRWEIEDQACRLAEQPCKVSLNLQSFRAAHCTYANLPSLQPLWFGLPNEPIYQASGGQDYFAVALLGLYVAAVGTVDAGILGYDAAVAAMRSVHNSRSRPRELLIDYPAGVACDMRVNATVAWPNGHHQEMELHAQVNRSDLPSNNGPSADLAEDIRLVVQAACTALGQEFKERIVHPEGQSEPKEKARTPAFSAYSGN
jgi:hypothetical protein